MPRTLDTIPRLAPAVPVDPVPIAVAPGDGIGPEITHAVLRVLDAAGARIAVEEVAIGARAVARGVPSGIDEDAWATIRHAGVLLKAPLATTSGGGAKSVNVTLRKALGLYAAIRPCTAYHPFVPTLHPGLDLVIVRENEEDVYAGIEHRQTDDVVQCLRIVSRQGCERIVRTAFEHARRTGRTRVTCLTKDTIMKLTDGLFRRTFEEIAAEYPALEAEHLIVDIGMARLAAQPGRFEVIVAPNLYGDIASDVAAEVAGSVGLAPCANIGDSCAVFEAVHGSAPDIAGLGIANPSGLLLAASMMLGHLGQDAQMHLIHDAWLTALEDGIATPDIAKPGAPVVGTAAFADAVIERLGEAPLVLERRPLMPGGGFARPAVSPRRPAARTLAGIDVFVRDDGDDPAGVAARIALLGRPFTLRVITNRGVRVWPGGFSETGLVDHWRCRFLADGPVDAADVVGLLARLVGAGVEVVKTEHLYRFDGAPGWSAVQGE